MTLSNLKRIAIFGVILLAPLIAHTTTLKIPGLEYPKDAMLNGVEGWVIAQIEIAADGSVVSVTVTASDPPGVFDEAAVNALKRWRFKPSEDGLPRFVHQTIEFQLNDD